MSKPSEPGIPVVYTSLHNRQSVPSSIRTTATTTSTALSSYRLRDGVAPVLPLCLMLRNEYRVPVGAIRYWPVRIGAWPVLLLGPIAVHPTTQGEGLGALLMRESLERALALGETAVMRPAALRE